MGRVDPRSASGVEVKTATDLRCLPLLLDSIARLQTMLEKNFQQAAHGSTDTDCFRDVTRRKVDAAKRCPLSTRPCARNVAKREILDQGARPDFGDRSS